MGGLGSDSDRPFNSPHETELFANVSKTVSRNGPHSLLFGVNYSSRRSFLRNIPFPFVYYTYNSEKLSMALPFSLLWHVSEKYELSASYSMLKYFRVSARLRSAAGITAPVYTGQKLEQFLLAGRSDKARALFLEETFSGISVSYPARDRREISASYEYLPGGRYFSGDSYDDHHDKVDLGAGSSVAITLRLKL